jgi:hypothetical protein
MCGTPVVLANKFYGAVCSSSFKGHVLDQRIPSMETLELCFFDVSGSLSMLRAERYNHFPGPVWNLPSFELKQFLKVRVFKVGVALIRLRFRQFKPPSMPF